MNIREAQRELHGNTGDTRSPHLHHVNRSCSCEAARTTGGRRRADAGDTGPQPALDAAPGVELLFGVHSFFSETPDSSRDVHLYNLILVL